MILLGDRYILTVLMAFFTVLCFAQDGKDSIYFYTADQQLVEQQMLSPTFSKNTEHSSHGTLGLYYDYATGGFRKAQQAYSSKTPVFNAKGFNKIGKFRIAGAFEFNNNYDDSLANGQRHNLDELTTFNHHANKSTDYVRQNYIMDALGSYDMTSHWSASLGMHYHKHWSAGTADPRLRSDRFIVKIKPGISYSFRKNNIGAYYLLGKADEDISIRYKNINFKESTMYPDRLSYINYGYGNTAIIDSAIYKYDNYKGIGLEYALHQEQWKVQAGYEYELFTNNNYFQRRTSIRSRGIIGTFRLTSMKGLLNILHQSTASDQQHFLSLAVDVQDGYDGNLNTTGSLDIVNYKANQQKIEAHYHFLWDKKSKNTKEIGFTYSNDQMRREDLSQSVLLQTSNNLFSIYGKWYNNIGHGNALIFGTEVFLGCPGQNKDLRFNTLSMTEFIRNVVFTDYYFYNSSYYGASLQGEYIFKKFAGNHQLGFFLHAQNIKQQPIELNSELNPTFIPNKHRISYRMGVHMYLEH